MPSSPGAESVSPFKAHSSSSIEKMSSITSVGGGGFKRGELPAHGTEGGASLSMNASSHGQSLEGGPGLLEREDLNFFMFFQTRDRGNLGLRDSQNLDQPCLFFFFKRRRVCAEHSLYLIKFARHISILYCLSASLRLLMTSVQSLSHQGVDDGLCKLEFLRGKWASAAEERASTNRSYTW